MADLTSIPILPLVLTLLLFQLSHWLQQKLKSPLLNPILVSAILILIFLRLTGISIPEYQSGIIRLSWLLTPATICLAVPMYEQLQMLRRNLAAILAGIAAGALSCLLMILLFGMVAGFEPVLTISLLPKSITTAIGMVLSEMSGGMPGVTTAGIAFTGISASIFGSAFCKLFHITDPVAQGVAFGTAGHVIGTSRANEISPLSGAVSSLSLVVAGLLTAVVWPIVSSLF